MDPKAPEEEVPEKEFDEVEEERYMLKLGRNFVKGDFGPQPKYIHEQNPVVTKNVSYIIQTLSMQCDYFIEKYDESVAECKKLEVKNEELKNENDVLKREIEMLKKKNSSNQ